MEQEKYDLCTTCENYWVDALPPITSFESHCKIMDKKEIKGSIDDIVPYPCKKCPLDSYIKIT